MKKTLIILILLIAFGGLLYFNYGNPLEKKKVVNLVSKHLEEKGETKATIKSLKPIYDKKGGIFITQVIFNDEPSLVYDYTYSEHYKEVLLLDITNLNKSTIEPPMGKHDSVDNY